MEPNVNDFVPYTLFLKDQKKPVILMVPVSQVAMSSMVQAKCTDDSLPTSFEPQEGHWVEQGKYYRLLGVKPAVNDPESFSMIVAKQDGTVLNPYGDEKASYGIHSKRFQRKEQFDVIEMFLN